MSRVVLLALVLAACGEKDVEFEPADSGSTDDGGSSDGGSGDGGGPIDADEDGYTDDVDCDDSDASVHPDADELCEGGRDEDCDGRPDCEDADCAEAESCAEDCFDGVDDDGDGHVDCADDDCATEPACVEVSERVAGGSLYYRQDQVHGWYTYYSAGADRRSFVFEDLTLSMRWWELSSWHSCQWGADRVTMNQTFSGAHSGWGWYNDVEVSGSWWSGCGPDELPALEFYLGEPDLVSGEFSACRGVQVWNSSGGPWHAPGCIDESWLGGSTSGYDRGSDATSWESSSGYDYGWERTTWRSFNAPELTPGPWSTD